MSDWQPIETAPKDRPKPAWCDHEADPYFEEDSGRLTLYGGHAEGMSHAPTGYHIVEWGGAYEDSWEDGGAHMPDWWFVVGSDFECAANPTHWTPLPFPPTKGQVMTTNTVPGISALQCVISSLRDTAHLSDEGGELTDQLRELRDWALSAAAQPTAGFVLVPTELAERVQETMGEFLMDHGWRQQDMDTSDEFDAALAAKKSAS